MSMLVISALGLSPSGCDATPTGDGPLSESPKVIVNYGYLPEYATVALDEFIAPECIETRYYYCPPLNEVWQSQVMLNVCTNEVLAVGDCEEVFECNPTVFALGSQVCETDMGQPGQQDVFCDKGLLITGPCAACGEEVCDGLDNNCDGFIDNLGSRSCETTCGEGVLLCIDAHDLCLAPEPGEEVCDGVDNDCDGEVDEGQTNACGHCGAVPQEVCDGIDEDCDGEIDEGLFEPCQTACGQGHQTCEGGNWSMCSAKAAIDEVCNGIDDDCDGEVDEDISCSCDISELGSLHPCQASPLLCGQGWQQCQCEDASCTSTILSDCHALCWFLGGDDEDCVDEGVSVDEICNAHDDDCNDLIDEELTRSCYSGPAGTAEQGDCTAGIQHCEMGSWGYTEDDTFVPGFCFGEVLPAPKDYCNGSDEDCDGIVDAGTEMVTTDIVLIIDWSASMEQELNAVLGALVAFAQAYSDDELLKWSVILGPVGDAVSKEQLLLVSDLTSFDAFMETMLSLDGYPKNGMYEMFLDALWLTLGGTAQGKTWNKIGDSQPTLHEFGVSWREDTNKVVIIWTDEMPQSHLQPELSTAMVKTLLGSIEELHTYVFTPVVEQGNWQPIAEAGGGKWYELSTSTAAMFTDLMDILDEAVCL